MFRIADAGGVLDVHGMQALVRRLGEVIDDLGPAAPRSLTALSARGWQQHLARAVQRRTGALPSMGAMRNARDNLLRCYRQLWVAYDPRPWWRHETWDPTIDTRIPQRPHEPLGRRSVNFLRVQTSWLREGLQWYYKVALDTGALCWSTVNTRLTGLAVFDAFLTDTAIAHPWLADDPARVRTLMLDYLGHVKAMRVTAGPNRGRPLSPGCATNLLVGVEQFYAFMHDHQDAAAAALDEPGWLRLGPQHARFYRHGEKPRQHRGLAREPMVIDDDAFTQIMAGAGTLGDPVAEGGLGDEQAMRILMLLARTGRRVNEILMLDRDPLLPLEHPPARPRRGRRPGRVRGPAALPADQDRRRAGHHPGRPGDRRDHPRAAAVGRRASSPTTPRRLAAPKYLFLAHTDEPQRRPPLPGTNAAHRADASSPAGSAIRDSTGRLVDFQRTHRFRHTRATSLLNAGVPLHVVQRYLGHLSPTMTMDYAADPGRDPRAGVPALPQDHRRRPRARRRPARPLRHARAGQAHRPDPAQRLVPAAAPPGLRQGQRLPDLRQVRHRRDLPARAADPAGPHRAAHRPTPPGVPRRAPASELDPDNVWLAGRRQEHDALARIIVALEHRRTRPTAVAPGPCAAPARPPAPTPSPPTTAEEHRDAR